MQWFRLAVRFVLILMAFGVSAKELSAPFAVGVPPETTLRIDDEQPVIEVSDGSPAKFSLDPAALSPGDPTSSGGYALNAHIDDTLLSACSRAQYLQDLHPDGTPAFNRFQWWSKQAPSSGPINLNGPSTLTFECEFFSGLTTVVGGALDLGAGVSNVEGFGYDVLPWDSRDASGGFVYSDLHALPRIQFAVRSHDPLNVPVLETVIVQGGIERRLLVNRAAPGHALDPTRPRPPLTLDFAFPQRAVGLEYGFINVTGVGDFPYASVRLIAYDVDGIAVAESNGDVLAFGGNDVEELQFVNRIGVQDRDGRIVSVELHFTNRESGDPILDPQALLRVWHAPLPPAAVLQRSVAIGSPPFVEDGETALDNGPVVHRLPFDHDRAMVFLRGFNVRFTDNRPHKISRIRARADSRLERIGDEYQITIDPDALMLPSADNSGLRNNAVIHYSVLSWRSTQTEIFQTRIGGFMESMISNSVSGVHTTPDPCPVTVLSTSSNSNQYRSEAESKCGQIFAGVDDVRLGSGIGFNDQSIDRFSFSLGTYDTWFNHSLGWILGPFASIFDDDRSLGWGVGAVFEGSGSDNVFYELSATALTGRSVHIGPDVVVDPAGASWLGGIFYIATPHVLTRPPKGSPEYWTYDWDVVRAASLSWPVDADVALVAMRSVDAFPGNVLRELEFEVIGAHYDGQLVDWRMAVGAGAGNAVSGGAFGGNLVTAQAIPQFAAVRRLSAFAMPSLEELSGLRCELVAGLGPGGCDGWGIIRNDGKHQAIITEVAPGAHPQDARFRYTFLWRGERIYDLDALRARLPLQLRPGESLFIGGTYTPEDPGDGSIRWVDTGFLHVRTDDPTLSATLAATGIGLAPSPGGEWRPNELVFEPVVSAGSSAQAATLVTTGATPLAINWSGASGGLYFEDPTLGFSVTPAARQPEPEAFVVLVDYTPQPGSAWSASTELIADTNAGLIRIAVRAQSFSGPGGL